LKNRHHFLQKKAALQALRKRRRKARIISKGNQKQQPEMRSSHKKEPTNKKRRLGEIFSILLERNPKKPSERRPDEENVGGALSREGAGSRGGGIEKAFGRKNELRREYAQTRAQKQGSCTFSGMRQTLLR